jgi:hypothetical protein
MTDGNGTAVPPPRARLPNFLGISNRKQERLVSLEAEIADAISQQRSSGGFAPMSDPERMKMVGQLAGQTIREAYGATALRIQEASNEVIRLVAAIAADGEDFVAKLKQIGEEHAARVEGAIGHLHGMMLTFSTERERLKQHEPPAPNPPQAKVD